MPVDQLNEFINRGGAALALTIIAFAVVYYVFGRDFEKLPQKKLARQ
jgi:hypothetical protein